MRAILTLTMATLLFIAGSPTVVAEPVTFMFAGEITSIFDPDGVLTGTVAVGSPFSGQYTFESGTTDSDPRNNFGQYSDAILSVSGAVGDIAFNGPIDSLNSISLWNDAPSAASDDYLLSTRISFFSQPLPLGLYLVDRDGLIFSDDRLPLVPPDLQFLEIASFGFGHEGFVSLGGRIAGLTPEPGTLVLLTLGGAATIMRPRASAQSTSPALQENPS